MTKMPAHQQQQCHHNNGNDTSSVGKSARNSAKFCNYSNYGPFELRNFYQNFIFLIVKFVPANL